MSFINWIQYTEAVVGAGSSSLTDVVNRPLRQVLTDSGIDPAGNFPGFLSNQAQTIQASWIFNYNVNINGNLVVAGTSTFTGAVAITSISGVLNVVGDFSVNTTKFTVSATTGDVVSLGTGAFTGALTGQIPSGYVLSGTFGANKTGGADTGAYTFPGVVNITGNFTIATTKFTVDSVTGNTVAAGSFGADSGVFTNGLTGQIPVGYILSGIFGSSKAGGADTGNYTFPASLYITTRLGIGAVINAAAGLIIGSTSTAAAGFVYGINYSGTLVASAIGDTLVGIKSALTFTPGVFTGLNVTGLLIPAFSVATFTTPGTPVGLDIGVITGTGATNSYGIRVAVPVSATNNYIISDSNNNIFYATSTGNVALAGNITLLTNATYIKGVTTGAATVNLFRLTSNANNITRFIAGVNAGGFDWQNQAENAQWMTLVSGVLNVWTNGSSTAGGGIKIFSAGGVSSVQNSDPYNHQFGQGSIIINPVSISGGNGAGATATLGYYSGGTNYGAVSVANVASLFSILKLMTDGGTVVVGTDPTGSQILRVGGDTKLNGLVTIPSGVTSAAGTGTDIILGATTQSTIGANGAASALTANPLGYIVFYIGTTKCILPYYNG